MDKITKPVARKFFELPVQTVIEANGKVIAKVDSFVKDSKLVNITKEDIEHLSKRHFSGYDLDDSIYSHETGERLEYLDGIANLDFLVWFANQIEADITGWDETREFMGFERDIRAERLCVKIYEKLEEIADFTEEELVEVEKVAESIANG
tara:strand:+ start:310 stop:762 length:453 start_codon:yes stop_codon:yes gene_type:complete